MQENVYTCSSNAVNLEKYALALMEALFTDEEKLHLAIV